MIERARTTIHRHTYQGRYEQFMAKHADRLAETKGSERYDFEKRLQKDARKYANRTVLGEIAVVGSIALGGYVGYRAARDNWQWNDVVGQAEEYAYRVSDTVQDLIREAIRLGDRALQHIGNKIADGAGQALVPHGQTLLRSVESSAPLIGRGFAQGARVELEGATDHILEELEMGAMTVGTNLSTSMMDEIMERMPSFLVMMEDAAGRAGDRAGTGFSLGVMDQLPSLAHVAGESVRALGWTVLTGVRKKKA